MKKLAQHKQMISMVAEAMQADLLSKVAFVGGCTTGLLLTDAFSMEQVRHTDDVDLIVHVVGQMGWARFQEELRTRGFTDDLFGHAPICAMKLGSLRVDFMPDDPDVLGFSNRWYSDALATARDHEIEPGIVIRLVSPVYFVATKLEAYKGRGNHDPLASQDIEDLLVLFDGRQQIVEELSTASAAVRNYITENIQALLKEPSFQYAVQSASLNDTGREEVLFERLEVVAGISSK